MRLLTVLVLGSMFVLGCFGLWRAQTLLRHRASDFVKSNYGVVEPSLVSQASNLLGWLFLVWGLWFFASPVAVLTLNIPFNAWGGLCAVGIGIHFVGSNLIKRKFGQQHS